MDYSRDLPQQYPPNGGQVQTNLSTFGSQTYQRSNRPRPADMLYETDRNKHLSIAPETATPKLNKRTSRFGLAGLFGRSKVNLVEDQREKLATQWEGDEAVEKPSAKDSEISYTNERPSPSLEFSALPEMEVPTKSRASKAALRSKPSFKKENATGKPVPWSPPPLFQAYPQAVKHATLRVPILSAETILRLQHERDAGTNQRSDSYTPTSDSAKTQKEKKSKKPRTSDVLSKSDWSDKIFVLVTSGYVLQYAGDGTFDRLPEKIMPLSKDSAAFASDAIPGKPYVLQISHVSDEEGRLNTEASKSMFKKLGIKVESKRSTSCFFLVLESPDDMSSWLVTVRKEIEAMGGKEYKPDEVRRPATGGAAPLLQSRPSQRYLVKRDPNRFFERPRDLLPHRCPDGELKARKEHLVSRNLNQITRNERNLPTDKILGDDMSMNKRSTEANLVAANRQSILTQRSMESRSLSNTTASINQMYLDGLKESPRQSYASTSGKTFATSRDSSPGPSPAKIHPETQDWTAYPYESRTMASAYAANTPNAITLGATPANEEIVELHPASRSFQPGSIPAQHRRTPSPAALNFSVPTFSKRYSTSTSPPALSAIKLTSQSPPAMLKGEPPSPPSPPMIPEEADLMAKSASPTEDLHHLRSSRPLPTSSSSGTGTLLTPPHSGSQNPQPASDGDRPYSRRFSSLEYSKGVSPIQLPKQTPAPHPPPSAALPALPPGDRPSRASIIPPQKTTLPIRSAKSSARYSMLPPPKTSLPPLPTIRPSSASATASKPTDLSCYQDATKKSPGADLVQSRKLSRPISMQVRKDPAPELAAPMPKGLSKDRDTNDSRLHVDIPASPTTSKTAFNVEGLTPPEGMSSPPKPTREPPPPPPSQPPQVQIHKSAPRIGREPPPVSSPPKSRISITSPAESYFDSPAPHPFIPPIKVSERKFRGSLDGPWNADYSGPQRNFLDLSVG